MAVAAMPAARARAARSYEAMATGSPARAATATAAAVTSPSGPGRQPFSSARRAMLGPLAMPSTQPRAPQGHSSPSRSTLMWPMCPALPDGPGRGVPSRTSPPPTPVDTTRQSALSWPRAAPSQCSAAVIATPSPTSATGSPSAVLCTRSTRGKARQPGTLTGLTVPAAASTGPALPMPTERAALHSGEAISSPSTSSTAPMTASAPSRRASAAAPVRGGNRRRPPARRRSWCRRCRARRRGRYASVWALRIGEGAGPAGSDLSLHSLHSVDNVVQGLCSTPQPPITPAVSRSADPGARPEHRSPRPYPTTGQRTWTGPPVIPRPATATGRR
ncbi:hypothetical protein SCALM49S_08512 [Streptomyces californicus]